MPSSDIEVVLNSRNVRRVRPKPYGDKPPSEVVNGTAEVCGKCFGRIEPDEPICIRSWARWWNYYYNTGYVSGPGPWCLDCASSSAVPYVSAGETVWPDRCMPHRFHGGTCGTCGRHVIKQSYRPHLKHFFCCYRCESTYYSRQHAKRRAAAREKLCGVCGKEFTATRVDQKTCSPACKQKAYRERNRSP